MTFVAQPYERFVDDLLIALTGGTIREEHEFVGHRPRRTPSGARTSIADSLRVFGQRDGRVRRLRAGHRLPLRRRRRTRSPGSSTGRPPDDRTLLLRQLLHAATARRRLTDRNPGSVTTTLAEAFAREYAVLHKQMEHDLRVGVRRPRRPGPSLDHVAALLGADAQGREVRRAARCCSSAARRRRATSRSRSGTLVSTARGPELRDDRRGARCGGTSSRSWCRSARRLEGAAGAVARGRDHGRQPADLRHRGGAQRARDVLRRRARDRRGAAAADPRAACSAPGAATSTPSATA